MMYPKAQPFPDDDRSRAAHARALEEIEKLNKLLRSRGYPSVSKLEIPTLITYIKAKDLGLLE